MNEEKFYLAVNKLKSNNIKITKPRKIILNSILNYPNNFTAEDIFINSHKIDSKIGIATVYRTIKLFEKFQLIDKNYSSTRKPIYNLALNEKSKKILKKSLAYNNNNYDNIHIFNNFSINTNNIFKKNKNKDTNFDLDNKNDIEKEIKLEELISDINSIDKVILKYENSKENLIQMLIDFQKEYNWLPKHVLFYVAKKVNVPLTQIYSIASFYTFFNLEPKGKYSVVVCAGTACHVRGSDSLLQRIINILKIKPGSTTPDLKFTLDTVNCLGCCALGPVMMFDNKYYSNPTNKQLEKLFSEAD